MGLYLLGLCRSQGRRLTVDCSSAQALVDTFVQTLTPSREIC